MSLEVIKEASAAGVRLFLSNGQLKVMAQKGALTPELKSRILAARKQVVTLLAEIQGIGGHDESQIIKPALRKEAGLPLSFQQQRLWVVNEIQQGSSEYNIPMAFTLRGPFAPDTAEKAIRAIISRHEVLRSQYLPAEPGTSDSGAVQRIRSEAGFRLGRLDLTQVSADERAAAVDAALLSEATRVFDLREDLLLRATWMQLEADVGVLSVNMHHIVSDEWSIDILMREFITLYQAFSAGLDDPMPPLTIQYADYAVWQRQHLTEEKIRNQCDYWRNQLADAPLVHSLPLDSERPMRMLHRGASYKCSLPATVVEKLNAVASRHGMTLFMLIHAALGLLVTRHSNGKEAMIGTPVANRLNWQLEPLIGFFVNTLALRTRIEEASSIEDYLRHVREVNVAAQSNQDIPFDMLLEQLKIPRSMSHAPVFQITLSMHNMGNAALEQGPFTVEPRAVGAEFAQYDLTLHASAGRDGLDLSWNYDAALFEPRTIERYSRHLNTILSALIATSGGRVRDLVMLSEEDRRQLVRELNDTSRPYDSATPIHQHITRHAAASPDRIAVVCGNESIDYRSLEKKANDLADLLRKRGVRAGQRIGIALSPSTQMVIAILAIMKVGGTYVPVDADHRRVSSIVRDSKMSCLLTDAAAAGRLKAFPDLVVPIDTLLEGDVGAEDVPSTEDLEPDSEVCILYTSDSTGSLRGVPVTERGLANYLSHAQREYMRDSLQGAILSSPLTSAVAITTLFPPLISGRKLVILSGRQAESAAELPYYLFEQGGDWLFKLTPAQLDRLVARGPEHECRASHVIVIGGEPLYQATARALRRAGLARSVLINEYGQTETAGGCSTHTIPPGEELLSPGVAVPIGRPIQNTQAFVIHHELPVVDLDADAPLWTAQSAENPDTRALALSSRHLAYVIYTSGSTGRPKGVMIEHRSLVNHIAWQSSTFGFTRDDAILQRTSISFDASVWELWTPLAIGGRLVLLPQGAEKDPARILQTLERQGVTIAQFVPTLLRTLVAHSDEGTRLPCRYLFSGGEPLDTALAEKARTLTTGLVNLYGPTEVTIDSTAWRCPPERVPDPIPIGRPIANTRIYILDALRRPLPIGVVGEIHIGGAGVARGYLNRQELSAERFIESPFVAGDRLYKTGDLGRFLPDGRIEFLGRNDFQVKIRGFRIELAEIEARLSTCEGVREAVVTAHESGPGEKRLVAYYTTLTGDGISVELLKSHLSRTLASHMVPAAYVHLAALPLTPNGKVDRKALPAPEGSEPVPHRQKEREHDAQQTLFCQMLGDMGEPMTLFGLQGLCRDGAQISAATHALDPQLSRRLRQCARMLGAGPNSIFHVAWGQLLSRASGQPDPVFGTVVSGRTHSSVNTLPVRVRSKEKSIEQCVRETHELLAEVALNEHSLLAEVQHYSRASAGAPLFTAVLDYRDRPSPVPLAAASYPLALSVLDEEEGFTVTARVVTSVGPDRIHAMLVRVLQDAVDALETNPTRSASDLEVLPEDERQRVLVQWNDTQTPYPEHRCVHELFEEQVVRDPDAIAVVYEDRQLSYGELNRRANQLAHYLRSLGVRPDQRVALCMERSPEMVVGLLGILKAGAGYVPLDPAYPVERLSYMLRDSTAVVVLCHAATRAVVRAAAQGLGRESLAPFGAVGELYIGGDPVAKGYLDAEDLEAPGFVALQLPRESLKRLYRTGDLVRYNANGDLEYAGRADEQVILHGLRVEPREIQARLCTHPRVKEAVVLLATQGGSHSLVAFVVPSDPKGAGEGEDLVASLQEWSKQHLVTHLQPAAYKLLEAIPLTRNGKVDRRALLDLPLFVQGKGAYAAPRNHVERVLCEIYAGLLDVERVGIHDNFFGLGGDSILSIQAVSRARKAGVNISASKIFTYQTVAELAQVAEVTGGNTRSAGDVAGEMPLLPIHRSFFAADSVAINHFNQSVLLKIPPVLDFPTLRKLVRALYLRHDALRLRFRPADGAWQARFVPFDESLCEQSCVAEVLPETSEAARECIRDRCEYAQRSLNLQTGPLFRAVHFTSPAGEHRLFLVLHHAIVDGVSWRVLLADIEEALQQSRAGKDIHLPPGGSSYKEWSLALERYSRSDVLSTERVYWLRQLQAPADLPARSRPSGPPTQAESRELVVELSRDDTKRLLSQCSHAYSMRTLELLLAALGMGLRRWLHRDAVLIETEGHGREELFPDLDVSDTVGWFTTLYPLALSCGPRSMAEVLIATKEQVRALPGNGIGYGALRHLVRDEQIVAAERGNAPQLIFNYLGQFDQAIENNTELSVAGEDSGRQIAPERLRSHKVAVNAAVLGGALRFVWDYSPAEFDEATIALVANHVLDSLKEAIEHCVSVTNRVYTPSDFPGADVALEHLRQWQERYSFEKLYRVTPVQQGMLAASELERNAYVIQFYPALRGQLDEVALERAWQHVVDRHDMLRTVFVTHDEGIHQLVLTGYKASLRVVDLRHIPQAAREAEFERHRQEDKEAGFLLNDGPAHRMALFRMGGDRYRLLLTNHHAILDGWSMAIVLNELFSAYHAATRSRPLSGLRGPDYENYVSWVYSRPLEEAKSFWKQHLGDISETALLRPARSLRLAAASYDQFAALLDEKDTDELRACASRYRTTLNTVVQLAWSWVLRCYTGREDVVFGAVVSGRPAEVNGVEKMVGLFMNTIPVRIRLGDGAIGEMLAGIQSALVESNQYAYLSLPDIKRQAGVRGDLDMFETIVDFKNYADVTTGGEQSDLVMEDQNAHDRNSFPVTVSIGVYERLQVKCCYRDDLLPPAFINSMIEDFLHVLRVLPGAGSLAQIRPPGADRFRPVTPSEGSERTENEAQPLLEAIRNCLATVPDIAELALTCRTVHLTSRISFEGARHELNWLDDIRRRLLEQLPADLLPDRIHLLRFIPRTPEGEVDEPRLHQMSGRTLYVDTGERQPTPLEERLCQMLATVLDVRSLGVRDNFFELGGDSMLALRLCGLARKQGIPLTVAQIYRLQTLAGIAADIEGKGAPAAARGESAGKQRLLPIQQQILVARSGQDLNRLRHFNMASLFNVPDTLSMEALRASMRAILKRHDVLRLEFAIEEGVWCGRYRDYDERMLEAVCHCERITGGAEVARAALERRCQAYHQGFDLSQAPLLRLVKFESPLGARLFLVAHHSVVDVLSWQVLVSDLRAALEQHARTGVVTLGDKTASYQEWGKYLNDRADQGSFAGELDYWLRQIPAVRQEFPCERAVREPATFGNLAHVPVSLTQEETARLLRDCQSFHDASINEVLLTALYRGLCRWSGRAIHSIYIMSHGRHSDELDLSETVGWFTETYPIALERSFDDVRGCLEYVKETYRSVPSHGLGYGVLRYLCNDRTLAEREERYSPQVVLNYSGQLDGFVNGAGDLEFSTDASGPIASDEHEMPYKLVFQGGVYAGSLAMTIEYNRRRFAETDIRSLADAFRNELLGLCDISQTRNTTCA